MTEVQAHQRKHGFISPVIEAQQDADLHKAALRQAKGPNKTEAEFGRILEARKTSYGAAEFKKITFEGATLRLADRLRYTPDFMCESVGGSVMFFEVKGGWIDGDSVPKFKMAREVHKWASFEMWQKKKGSWSRIL